MKRIISVFMVLCLIVAMTPAAFATGEEPAWDGVTISSSLSTVDGVYQISNGADLAKFADMINKNQQTSSKFELTANINLGGHTFTPIGANATEASHSRYSFSGEFNGNGFMIYNAVIASAENMGIFGYVKSGANIYNLDLDYITVSQPQAVGSEPAIGVLAGSVYKATITDIFVGEHCVVNGVQRVGGVIGSVRDGCTIDNCDSEAAVTCTGMYCGGIVGVAHDLDISFLGTLTGSPATIKNCDNSGTVSGNTEVGGIVGYTDQTTIQNCNNSGDVTATGNYGCGGIVGFDAYNPRSFVIINYEPDTGATITGCDNSGTINGPRSGGIVGTLGVTPGQDQPDEVKTLTKIIDCDNFGDITGTSGKCGAIFGYQITYAHGDASEYINHLYVNIQGCTFDCNVNNQAATVATESEYVN